MNRRIIGILGFLLGISIIIVLYILIYRQNSNIIFNKSDIFTVKYFLPILFINGAFFFITFGILNFFGILKPYYSNDIDEYDKAKNSLLSIILTVPTWVSGTILILNIVDQQLFIILWLVIIFGIFISLISNIKTLKNGK